MIASFLVAALRFDHAERSFFCGEGVGHFLGHCLMGKPIVKGRRPAFQWALPVAGSFTQPVVSEGFGRAGAKHRWKKLRTYTIHPQQSNNRSL